MNKKFISFEGIDFSGKSTQIEILKDNLKQHEQKVIVVREPGGTKISELIREILLDKNHLSMTSTTELLLYSAARNQLLNEKIIPELKKGSFVIADRYVDSTTAYQGFGRDLPKDMIQKLNQAATDGFLPNVTIFLDLPVEKMLERQGTKSDSIDRLESAGINFFKRVRQGYLNIAKNNSDRFYIVDACQEILSISDQIWELVVKKTDLSN